MPSARASIRALWLVPVLVAAGVLVWLAGSVAERRALVRLGETARAAAILRQAHLDSEIERFRLLPLALADDRDLVAALGGAPAARAALNRKLTALARTTGAAQIYALDAAGTTIAASNWASPRSFVGQNYAARAYYAEAKRQGSGAQFALGTVSERPGLYLSHRAQGAGFVVVKLEFDAIEREWAGLPGIGFVTDRNGTVLITSRPEWRFLRLPDTRATANALPIAFASPQGEIRTVRMRAPVGEQRLWASVPADEAGWRLNLLLPIQSAQSAATLTRLVAALALLLMAGAIWTLRERARRRAERAALAAARTAELESLVTARTEALRREMDERAASDARAAELREALHQANRLASLGQIMAGIAHETAQPVAAIRSYAINGRKFLDRADTQTVAENFDAIARLTERIGAVTARLRGFARRAPEAPGPVRLADAIDGSLLIVKPRLAEVALHLPTPPADLAVIADTIRLEQVLVNLLQNALDATEQQPEPAITLDLAIDTDRVRLTVADNGPGIAPDLADRLFIPFATSRPAGLGLGLVIAGEIVTEFGGTLRHLPGSGGARFEIALRRA